MGFRTVIVIPETQSQEKKDFLRLCGAELREVPAVPYKNPDNYVHVAERLARSLTDQGDGSVLYANQWDNTSNREGHYRSTGPEIWRQTEGTVDAFTCAIGTGGTLAGVSSALKERKSQVVIAAADPIGAAMYNWFKHGELKSEGSSITEGIGQGRVTGNIDGAQVDDAFQIEDAEAVSIVFDLLQHEGLCLGGSSGINVAGAMRLAKELGPGKTIVTVLCDYGTRYQSKLFNPAFLRDRTCRCRPGSMPSRGRSPPSSKTDADALCLLLCGPPAGADPVGACSSEGRIPSDRIPHRQQLRLGSDGELASLR